MVEPGIGLRKRPNISSAPTLPIRPWGVHFEMLRSVEERIC